MSSRATTLLRALVQAFLAAWLSVSAGRAATGVIIPSGKQSADASELSIESLHVGIAIDNGHATVHFDEVFRNKTNRVLEGTYSLALPGDAAISDFAVWDDLTRIPGVILERKRAGELYDQIRNQIIDPALLESGDISESTAPGEARRSTAFSVKITPIPAWGYKRVEAEYRQTIPLNQLSSEFILPLKSSDATAAPIPHISINLELESAQALSSFHSDGSGYPLKIAQQTSHRVRASFEGADVVPEQDFAVRYSLENDSAPQVVAYRDGTAAEPGYFEASAILPAPAAQSPLAPRTVIVLFDASLSMQWEKLERSFTALETTLRSLSPQDRFNVLVFNSDVSSAGKTAVAASPAAVARALDFVRESRLKGGTNMQKAFSAAFAESASDTTIVLLSDGGMTEGVVSPSRFTDWFERTWSELPELRRPHVYALAIGDDANTSLLRRLAAHDGVCEQVGSTEPLEFKLNNFVRTIGLTPFSGLSLDVSRAVQPQFVYRLGHDAFAGSRPSWVGQYAHPGSARFAFSATGPAAYHHMASVKLPERELDHPFLPATWARARVDALLDKIDREGEDRATIEEIIRLSREYHFVTPYTSFLAAPRALLRPRLIRPGDPVLRLRTDASIVSVIALFPFGMVKPLRYLRDEDIWQTRFLAPADLPDGPQSVRVILRDRAGHIYRESKTFFISSSAPVVRVRLDSSRVHAGQPLTLHVQASATTRTITATLYGASPLLLHWNDADRTNEGILAVPSFLPAGRYSLHVTAEDMAHNISQQEMPIEVLP